MFFLVNKKNSFPQNNIKKKKKITIKNRINKIKINKSII